MLNVAVIGSRDFNNDHLVYEILDNVNNRYKIDKIISGGARGVDSLAKTYSKNNKIKYLEFLPDWKKYNKSAGFLRNYSIIKNSNLTLAFLKNDSVGTRHGINLNLRFMNNVITLDPSGNIINEYTKIYKPVGYEYMWNRRVNKGETYFECSSKGHKEYSAIYAEIKNKSIEEIYQLDIKGYRGKVKHWKDAKGQPPLIDISIEEQYRQYINLWKTYLLNNKMLYINLLNNAYGKTITDMFGVTEINQARALCDICNSNLLKL